LRLGRELSSIGSSVVTAEVILQSHEVALRSKGDQEYKIVGETSLYDISHTRRSTQATLEAGR